MTIPQCGTIQCGALVVWCANFNMGNTVPNLVLSFIEKDLYYSSNGKLQTASKDSVDILSHINQAHTATFMLDQSVPPKLGVC